MTTDQELLRLNAISIESLSENLVEVVIERDRYRAELDDINDSYRIVMDEKCAHDERHCTCVPFLRAELKRYRVALEWMTHFNNCNVSGEVLRARAKEALAGAKAEDKEEQ